MIQDCNRNVTYLFVILAVLLLYCGYVQFIYTPDIQNESMDETLLLLNKQITPTLTNSQKLALISEACVIYAPQRDSIADFKYYQKDCEYTMIERFIRTQGN